MGNEVNLTQQEDLAKQLEVYAEKTIEKETKELLRLMDIVIQAVDVRLVNGEVTPTVNFSAFELEALAMRIPAECLRLQSRLNQYNVKNTFRDMSLDAKVTVSRSQMIGAKGTADERRKKAELGVLDERLQNTVNKLIIKGIQGCIERADKMYEGVKKVIDYRGKEGWFDRKGPQ